MIKSTAVFVLALLLAACGGGGGGSSAVPQASYIVATSAPTVAPSAAATPITTLLTAVAPTPFSPSSSLVITAGRRPQAVATPVPTDETVWGLGIPSANGLYALQTFDLNFQVAEGNTLYAPTMKIQAACLEMSTYYTGYDSGVWVWDWCSAPAGSNGAVGAAPGSGSFIITKLSNSVNALGPYLRNLGNAYAEYAGEIYRDGSGYWHAVLYNFSTGHWDDIYNTTLDTAQVDNSVAATDLGWDMYEQHYLSGTYCPQFGTIGSRNLTTMSANVLWTPATLTYFIGASSIPSSPTISPCLPWSGSLAGTPINPDALPPDTFTHSANSWLATSP